MLEAGALENADPLCITAAWKENGQVVFNGKGKGQAREGPVCVFQFGRWDDVSVLKFIVNKTTFPKTIQSYGSCNRPTPQPPGPCPFLFEMSTLHLPCASNVRLLDVFTSRQQFVIVLSKQFIHSFFLVSLAHSTKYDSPLLISRS